MITKAHYLLHPYFCNMNTKYPEENKIFGQMSRDELLTIIRKYPTHNMSNYIPDGDAELLQEFIISTGIAESSVYPRLCKLIKNSNLHEKYDHIYNTGPGIENHLKSLRAGNHNRYNISPEFQHEYELEYLLTFDKGSSTFITCISRFSDNSQRVYKILQYSPEILKVFQRFPPYLLKIRAPHPIIQFFRWPEGPPFLNFRESDVLFRYS